MPCITHETEQERREAARRHEQALTGPLHQEIDRLKTQLVERDAMLCGVLTSIEEECGWVMLEHTMDEKEAGVTVEDILSWFEQHREKDRQRRAKEAATREARRQKVLSKLSAEERELLGIKE